MIGETLILMIKKLGIFTIIAQTFLHFIPNKAYEKYIKTIIGSITIVIIISPIVGILHKGTQTNIWDKIDEWQATITQLEQTQKMTFDSDNSLVENGTKKEIANRINKILEEDKYEVKTISFIEEESRLLVILKSTDPFSDNEQSAEVLCKKIAERLTVNTSYLEVRLND